MDPTETILIVDDEESIRQTFKEWLAGAALGCAILTAKDAETALDLANKQPIDLAILDWNLGAGDDGLHLLQDLVVFHPDVVAILVTGYANQATPLDAMRMGVRDYLDKNHDLSRDAFLRAVRKQLDALRPAKRARHLQKSLAEFRANVEKALPLVQSASALADPVPLPATARHLVRFVVQATGAKDGVILVRHYDAARQPAEWQQAFDIAGNESATGDTPFAQSLAGAAASREEACVMNQPTSGSANVALYPFEKNRTAILVAPMLVATGVQAVIELFDKPGGFTAEDQRLAHAAAELGADLVRHALGQRTQERMLAGTLGAALGASEHMARTLEGSRPADPPPAAMLDQVRAGLAAAGGDPALAQASVDLAEAIRVLGLKHGPAALRHCLTLIDDLRELLDEVTGSPLNGSWSNMSFLDDLRAHATPARLLHDPAATGAGVRVAVLDSGADQSLLSQRHPHMAPLVGNVFSANEAPRPYLGQQSTPHGTTVADIVLTMAPKAELFIGDIFGPAGACEVDVVIKALAWAIDVWKCRVVNLSLGVVEQRLTQLPKQRQFLKAIEDAYFQDVLVVAAAHNDHPFTKSFPALFAPPLVSVDKHLFAEPTQFAYRPHERVEFQAHARGYLGPFAGEPATSWAAPHLAGLAARILSLEPSLKPFEVKTLLYWLASSNQAPQ